jgi:serine/threonine-protein kinase RsbW
MESDTRRRHARRPVDLQLQPHPEHLPELRRAAARLLDGVDRAVADEVLLALDEAVSNAIRHGSRGGKPVWVRIRVERGWIELTVRDHGPTPRTPRVPPEQPPVLASGGRGLWLLAQLVDEVRLRRAGSGTLVQLRRRAHRQARGG